MIGLVLFRAMLMILIVNNLSDVYDGISAVLRNDHDPYCKLEQNRKEVYLKIPKGINATRIYKHNITQCTIMAVDGVVIKCSRICNKHKYFVSVVEKLNYLSDVCDWISAVSRNVNDSYCTYLSNVYDGLCGASGNVNDPNCTYL